ncbi:MAG: hypothetical protein K5990_08135 [Oscillospiraceae bacterium]|nr:hypothetical protein [Oscillospiraceae bacterium]
MTGGREEAQPCPGPADHAQTGLLSGPELLFGSIVIFLAAKKRRAEDED